MSVQDSLPITGYIELASAQLLDDKWRELNFDLTSDQNVLQDIVIPESGGGHVYREAGVRGSAMHNRFLYWKTTNDVLELIEMSTEVVLDGNQVRIRFVNSPIINEIRVIELSDSIVIMVANLNSVHRIHLPHPKTTNKSVLHELTNDVLFTSSNYYILNNQQNSNQTPISSTSWSEENSVKSALSFSDGSLLIVQFSSDTHHISTYDIKQSGIIGRIWSRMPNLLTRNPNDCANAIFICSPHKHHETNDVLLFTLCRDMRIRIFSTSTRECVHTYSVVSQSSFTQSFSSHANLISEQPLMKVFGSRIVIYLTENNPEFILLTHDFSYGIHSLKDKMTVQTPSWEKLMDFHMSEYKIWALANVRETESTLCYLDLRDSFDKVDDEGEIEGIWDYVNVVDDLDGPTVKNYVTEIFWSGRFSIDTIKKALTGILGPSAPPMKNSLSFLEWLAFTKLVDQNQEEAWVRFYNYCVQNHHNSNKNIGLFVGEDECLVGIIKRNNPSFICPWLVNVDVVLQGGPYRGIEFSTSMRSIIEPLNYISTELLDEEQSKAFEDALFEHPAHVSSFFDEFTQSLVKTKKIDYSKLNFIHKNLISSGIDFISEQLDLTEQAKDFGLKVLEQSKSKLRAGHNPLESNSGIAITLELFKRIVRARMILARDLMIYIHLMINYSASEKSNTEKYLKDLCADLYNFGKVRGILDSLRSYAILVWITEAPIKKKTSYQMSSEVINLVADHFEFFKKASEAPGSTKESSLDMFLHQNLFMNFLINGGVNYSNLGQLDNIQSLSNSFYVTEIALNFCKLLWPKSNHMCFAEYLYTHRLDEHLDKFLNLSEDWLKVCEYDRHFIRATNFMLQNQANRSVEIFNRIWKNLSYSNLLGRFINLDKEKPATNIDNYVKVNPSLIYRYYDKLIQLFQIYDNSQCLVQLINHCMSLLDAEADSDQQRWINCFRAKLFQYYLGLDDPDEAYHTMVLTTDPSLRTNCLRKFIVSHSEREQWSTLLSYPFIDIKDDFIEILRQKAETSDLSKLNGNDFYRTSYYDLLFASYVSDDEFKLAASIMYKYAQRLAHEVPGVLSIKKQVDCLLIALNTLRCVDPNEAFIDSETGNQKEEGRTSVLKRAYDCESEASFTSGNENIDQALQSLHSRVSCRDLRMRYELTRARLRLLEKDQTANAIALSPLTPDETIAQLVASSMYTAAMDLALLFKEPIEPILEGLTAKYMFILQLSTVDIAVQQDLDRDLADDFTNSYSNIETYNYIANSTSSSVEKLWRLIDYYLTSFDGIGHRYSNQEYSKTFSGTTVLMRVVAYKLLAAGYDVPASLRRMYLLRNPAELLKLLIKFDKLLDATELAIEMTNRILGPTHCFAFTSPFASSTPPPLYLPTHLIHLLISFLTEDATNTLFLKTAEVLIEKIKKYRSFIMSV